jgi:prepilin-type N-terminal cleavage/methylation domain-containing protein
MRTAAGFTLIEMIAVLVVVGLLLAFSPMVLDFFVAEKELETEVSRLSSTIALVLSEAVIQQAPYAVHYDTEKHRYAVQIPEERTYTDPLDPDAEPKSVLELEEEVRPEDLDWHDLPADFKLELFEGTTQLGGRYRITFSPQGTVPPHTIVLESTKVSSLDDRDRIRTLKVSFPGVVSYSMGRDIQDFKLSEAEVGR